MTRRPSRRDPGLPGADGLLSGVVPPILSSVAGRSARDVPQDDRRGDAGCPGGPGRALVEPDVERVRIWRSRRTWPASRGMARPRPSPDAARGHLRKVKPMSCCAVEALGAGEKHGRVPSESYGARRLWSPESRALPALVTGHVVQRGLREQRHELVLAARVGEPGLPPNCASRSMSEMRALVRTGPTVLGSVVENTAARRVRPRPRPPRRRRCPRRTCRPRAAARTWCCRTSMTSTGFPAPRPAPRTATRRRAARAWGSGSGLRRRARRGARGLPVGDGAGRSRTPRASAADAAGRVRQTRERPSDRVRCRRSRTLPG